MSKRALFAVKKNSFFLCLTLIMKHINFLDVTAIGVASASEDLIIQVNVVIVDGVVEGDGDHLGHTQAVLVLGAEIARHLRAVLGAEAVRQLANRLVAVRCPVRVRLRV